MSGISTAEFIKELQRSNIRLQVEGGRLRVQAPTGAMTPALRSELARRKSEVMECLSRWRSMHRDELPPIKPQAAGGPCPLAFSQERLWFLERLGGGSPAYHLPFALRMRGELDPPTIRASLKAIANRHEVLRSRVVEEDGEPRQIVTAEAGFGWEFRDMSGANEEEIRTLLASEQDRAFDLAAGPLLRALLVRRSSDEHFLLIVFHHLVADGWSWGIFLSELCRIYPDMKTGLPAPLPPLPAQFADFSAWQRECLNDSGVTGQLAFWKDRLGEAAPVLELPIRRHRPDRMNDVAGSVSFRWPEPLAARLGRFARSHEATFFMTALAGFGLVLQRYSGQDAFQIGTPVANRRRQEWESLIGFFANTLALPIRAGGDPSFLEFFGRVRDAVIGAFDHQDFPFEKLVEAMEPDRAGFQNPLFQTMLVFQEAPVMPEDSPWELEPLALPITHAAFDLTVYLRESHGEITGVAEFKTELFSEEFVAGMMRHWRHLLEQVIAHPERPLSEAALLSPEERQRVLHLGMRPEPGPPPAPDVVRWFEDRVAAGPAMAAIEHDGHVLTYAELDREANRLANFLVSQGVDAGSVVAVAMPRSWQWVAAALGVLKCGAAYLPVDHQGPEERIRTILEDSGARALLRLHAPPASSNGPKTTKPHPGEKSLRTFCWDELSASPSPTTPPALTLPPDEPAYIIYTSGSTGTPKGVVVRHRQMLCHHLAVGQTFELAPGDRVLQFAAPTFDVSIEEVFPTLLAGGTVVLRTDEMVRSVSDFLESVARWNLHVLNLPTIYWNELVREGAAAGHPFPPCVRLVIVGGEKVPTDALAQWWEWIGPRVPWRNGYGPTETTITATLFDPARYSGEWMDFAEVPIGKPLPGYRVYILDPTQQPVPPEVTGELYIAGNGVARDYLNQPELTAAWFLPDPFTDDPNARMYRTGDLGRWLPDGNILFLGRNDFQVKLRGYRIELGEIESALRTHVEVRDCVVIDRPYGTERERELVAYYLPAGEDSETGDPDPRRFGSHLRSLLPEYMIPTAYVRLDRFPLTASGKVDRHALPASRSEEFPRAAGDDDFTTATEMHLSELWAEVLRRELPGRGDHFFELGGHSLLATRLVAGIHREFRVELPLRVVFECPRLADLAAEIDRRGSGPSRSEVLTPQPDTPEVPASYAQEALWFLQRLSPGDVSYNVISAWRIRGPLDTAALEKALNLLVERHEILRTSFTERGGGVIQIVLPKLEIPIPIEDVSEVSSAGVSLQLRLAQFAATPFDPAVAPLMDCRLLRLDSTHHLLVIRQHHLITDEWSARIFKAELSRLYGAISHGTEPELPPLPVQYRDFALWQRRRLEGDRMRHQLAFWQARFADDPPVLELAPDFPRHREPQRSGRIALRELAAGSSANLLALLRQEQATRFMARLAAYAVLLSRYSGQTEVVIGIPVTNRDAGPAQALLGLFLNTLAIRIAVDPDSTPRYLLQNVRKEMLEALENKDLPFGRLVEALQPRRDLSRHPLFQVMLVQEEEAPTELHFGPCRGEPIPVDNPVAKFDLSLYLRDTATGVEAALEYDASLFRAQTAHRMLGHFDNILQGLARTPDRPIHQIDLLSPDERRQMLDTWNQTCVVYDLATCLTRRFEQQARLSPEATAVRQGERSLTYRELNAVANRVAVRLQALHVRPDEPVALGLDRSIEMVAILYGVLKSGACYLPLEPEWPEERLKLILDDAAVRVVIAARTAVARLQSSGRQILGVDEITASGIPDEERDPPEAPFPSNLAYIIYTSGSTGKPKGVMIEHRSVVNRILWMQDCFRLSCDDVVLLKTPYSFDVSVWEFFWPLTTGACLVVADPGGHKDPYYLAELIARRGVTTVHFVPSMLHAFLAHAEPSKWRGLRRVICSGEALPPALVEEFFQAAGPETQLFNLYGPTEATVDVTAWRCDPGPQPDPIPIGKPIANTQTRILDARQYPVPIGVPGELYLGGVQLARGYLNRPELTAERFLPDPFDTAPGARLYRTGDRARYRADGAIEFLGRLDHQVKVRGLRIELGEVEAVVRSHPLVREAVVVLGESPGGDPLLAAYVTPAQPGEPVAVGEVRDHVRRQLPDYMVPARISVIDRLPLTGSGKLDRNALPAPAGSAPDEPGVESEEPPRNEVEAILAGLWQEELGHKKIGRNENFFALGGHSLMALRIVARLRDHYQRDVPVRWVFDFPTVAEFAARLNQLTAGFSDAPPLRARSQRFPCPPSFAQERLWFLDRLEGGSSVYNLPLQWELAGPLDVAALEMALNHILSRHEVLRVYFRASREGVELQVRPPDPLPLPVEDLSDLEPDHRREVVKARIFHLAHQSFHLDTGLLVRWQLLRLSPREHWLAVVFHHSVFDAWSRRVFESELFEGYRAFRHGWEPELPDLPVQYPDFGIWQRKCLHGELLNRQLAYWLDRLGGELPWLELPVDRPRPQVLSHRGGTIGRITSPALLRRVKDFARSRQATLFMTALAAFGRLLGVFSGQRDLIIGTPVANRGRSEFEPLIGLFLNTLPIRLNLEEDGGMTDLVNQTRTRVLEAFENQDLPFERLVEALRLERELSHHPVFQVMFVMADPPARQRTLEDLAITQREIDSNTAKFDLTLFVRESPEGLEIVAEYCSDLFERTTVARFLEHYELVLEQMVDKPEDSLASLPLLSAGDRRRILEEWNQTEVGYPETTFHHLFEAQADRTPDAIAVSMADGGSGLTYGSLNARANRLARRLCSGGVQAESIVAIHLERGPELLAAVLAVLKAGGCYLPLDPANPQERNLAVLNNAGARWLLTREKFKPRFSGGSLEVVVLDRFWEQTEAEWESNLDLAVAPGQLAYLMYTSGSTGVPKGVMVEHRQLCNYLLWARDHLVSPQGNGSVVHSSIAFDLTLTGLMLPLLVGQTVRFVAENGAGIDALVEAMRRCRDLNLVKLTPAHLELLSRQLKAEEVAGMTRQFVIGGEPLAGEPVRWWQAAAPHTRLVNEYGPTETVVGCTFHSVRSEDVGRGDIPIGKPIANARVYILDARQNPVPIGVRGEIYIAGKGVARGYWNLPELTAAVFLKDPFAPDPKARMYRSGDLGRWRADGVLEFLGRQDDQVKVRGYRVELGEIQSVLARHRSVAEAVVVYRHHKSGLDQLDAYIVPERGNPAVAPAEIRAWCRAHLPEYMVPTAYAIQDRLPLTAHGKVDRRALAPIRSHPGPGSRHHVPPANDLERKLAAIWSNLLNVEEIGVTDDFFALGGHSLLAVRLFSQIERFFGKDLPLTVIFQHPTIRRLAEFIVQRSETQEFQAIIPFNTVGSRPPILCFHGIGSHAYLYQELGRELAGDIPVYGVQGKGFDGDPIDFTSMESMVDEYVEQIVRLELPGPYYLAGFCAGGLVAMAAAHALQRRGKSVAALLLIETINHLQESPVWEESRRERISRHRDSLRKGGIAHIWKVASAVAYNQKQNLAEIAARCLYRFCLACHRKIPHPARGTYLNDFYRKVIYDYSPPPYNGDVIIFRSGDNKYPNAELGWKGICSGPIRVIEVPGDHHLWKRPHVTEFARRICQVVSPQ